MLLSPAQLNVLDALIQVTRDGWPATVREVMSCAGLASPSTAYAHLRTLEDRGYAVQHPRRAVGGWMPSPAERDLNAALLRRVA